MLERIMSAVVVGVVVRGVLMFLRRTVLRRYFVARRIRNV